MRLTTNYIAPNLQVIDETEDDSLNYLLDQIEEDLDHKAEIFIKEDEAGNEFEGVLCFGVEIYPNMDEYFVDLGGSDFEEMKAEQVINVLKGARYQLRKPA